jgi:hypothetical protein
MGANTRYCAHRVRRSAQHTGKQERSRHGNVCWHSPYCYLLSVRRAQRPNAGSTHPRGQSQSPRNRRATVACSCRCVRRIAVFLAAMHSYYELLLVASGMTAAGDTLAKFTTVRVPNGR